MSGIVARTAARNSGRAISTTTSYFMGRILPREPPNWDAAARSLSLLGGTEGSNPASSSEESLANLTSSIRVEGGIEGMPSSGDTRVEFAVLRIS